VTTAPSDPTSEPPRPAPGGIPRSARRPPRSTPGEAGRPGEPHLPPAVQHEVSDEDARQDLGKASSASPLTLASAMLRRFDRSLAESGEAPLMPLLAIFAVALVGYWIINEGERANLDYYVPLANAFLAGRLDLPQHPPWLNELVPWAGRWYVPYPPVPAVVLMPFVLVLGPDTDQARISILLGAVSVALAADVIYRAGVRGRAWVLFSFLFGFGTTFWYSAVAGSSWHFAHVCATLFMLLAIRDIQRGGPPWRAGLLLGLAGLCRLPVLLAFPFFLAYVAYRSDRRDRPAGTGCNFTSMLGVQDARPEALDRGKLMASSVWLSLGAGIPVVAYLVYNAARFGSPFELGYGLIPGLLEEYQYRYGFLSIHSIGKNLYSMLLSVPNSVEGFPWIQPRVLGGLSIFLTTPAFLWAIKARRRTWFTIGAWLGVLLVCVPILLHADPGGAQFGYRYAIDFYPLLLLLTIHGMRGRLRFESWLAVGMSFLVNLWGIWAFMNDWFA
jgi:hypothetical protein